jgi:5-methyltetrahydropteroyltriglutamate--homocysteine methyltransferase
MAPRTRPPFRANHFRFLASAVTTAVPKLTIPSPSMAHFRADLSGSGYAGQDSWMSRPRMLRPSSMSR